VHFFQKPKKAKEHKNALLREFHSKPTNRVVVVVNVDPL
jgi:hypothetical protein